MHVHYQDKSLFQLKKLRLKLDKDFLSGRFLLFDPKLALNIATALLDLL